MSYLKKIFDQHKIQAKKHLGQHFLHDITYCGRMLSGLNLTDQTVVEIGPGPGSLTHLLCQLPLKKLLLIEKDKSFESIHENLVANSTIADININYIDALRFLPSKALSSNETYHIIANLPYNIGSELLFFWIQDLPQIQSITVMLQREVVERMVSPENKPTYGRLSVMLQNIYHIEKLFDVPPQAFTPAPKVYSSVVRLIPKNPILREKIITLLKEVTTIAFTKRRKMLRSSLGKKLPVTVWQPFCANNNICETLRPENLQPKDYYELALWINQQI